MRNIVLIAITLWLLFAGGASTVQKWLNSNVPQTIVNGASKVIESQQIQAAPAPIQKPNPRKVEQHPQIIVQSMPILPTVTPIPEIIIVEPTRTPVVQLEEDGDPDYPKDIGAANWALHSIPTPDGTGARDCLYSYNAMRKYCWEPGFHPNYEEIISMLSSINSGVVQGEPINSYG